MGGKRGGPLSYVWVPECLRRLEGAQPVCLVAPRRIRTWSTRITALEYMGACGQSTRRRPYSGSPPVHLLLWQGPSWTSTCPLRQPPRRPMNKHAPSSSPLLIKAMRRSHDADSDSNSFLVVKLRCIVVRNTTGDDASPNHP